jgi:hypothetical protein
MFWLSVVSPDSLSLDRAWIRYSKAGVAFSTVFPIKYPQIAFEVSHVLFLAQQLRNLENNGQSRDVLCLWLK